MKRLVFCAVAVAMAGCTLLAPSGPRRHSCGARLFGVVLRSIVLVALVACSPSSPRDVVPVTEDVRGAVDAGPPDIYEHVAKRPHGTIAIAESRGMAKADAIATVDELADRFERCAESLQAQGVLVEGAARIVAEQDAAWSAPATSVRLAPGGAVAQNALLCLIAPLRSMQLKPASPKARAGLAIETTWQPLRL